MRGRGLLIGIELRRRVQPYVEALLEHGVLALQAGLNVIRLLPPLVITEEQLERVMDAVEDVLVEQPSPHKTSVPGDPAPALCENASPEVSLLFNMLTIPSYSRQESALASYLVEQARQMGLIAQTDEVGNLVASTPLGENAPGRLAHSNIQQPVILLGHMDTVRGVIPVRIQEGLLYGRGAVDAKGPLAAFLCAAARLARSGELQRPIVVIGAVEEEAATSRGARAVVERYQPYACIIGEPSGSEAVTIGYKGRLLVEYCVTRPLSHSAGPQQSSSEIGAAFWERVRTHAARWNQQHAGSSTFGSLSPSLRSIVGAGYLSSFLTEGKEVWGTSKTRSVGNPAWEAGKEGCFQFLAPAQDGLEEWTKLVIGYRLPLGYDIAGLRTQLQGWAQEDGARISFTGEEAAFQTGRTTPLARAFINAIRTTGGQPTFKHKTGTSDMNVVGPVWGQNIVAYGPGDSRLDHTPQEHISIAEYHRAVNVLEAVLRMCAAQKETGVGAGKPGGLSGLVPTLRSCASQREIDV